MKYFILFSLILVRLHSFSELPLGKPGCGNCISSKTISLLPSDRKLTIFSIEQGLVSRTLARLPDKEITKAFQAHFRDQEYLILVLSHLDRSHTLSLHFFQLSTSEVKEIGNPLTLPEGMVEAIADSGCLNVRQSVVHYNSAPPSLTSSASICLKNGILTQSTWTISSPASAWQYLNLAKEQLINGKPGEAESNYREGIYLLRNDPYVHPAGLHARLRYDFGMALYKSQQHEKARQTLGSILKDFSETQAALDLQTEIASDENLARLLKNAGQF